MGTQLDFKTVDVFTDVPYKGNPLAIVHLPKAVELTREEKLKIAKEFNLSETVFLHAESEASGVRQFDIFTTAEEVTFAGHPTIGSCCFIGMEAQSKALLKLKLQCKAGLIEGQFDPQSMIAEVSIPHNFNVHNASFQKESFLTTQPGLAKVLVAPTKHGEYPIASIVNGMNFVLVELLSVQDELAAVGPATAELPNAESLLDPGWQRGFMASYFFVVLASSDQHTTRLRVRMAEFVMGEDCATGSAACTLACYLSLKKAERRGQCYAYEMEQGVEMGRRSLIRVKVELSESGNIKRVLLSGRAVKVMEGKLLA